MSTAAIVVAAGRGLRAGGAPAKQWREIAGRRVVDWSLDAMRAAQPEASVLVVPAGHAEPRIPLGPGVEGEGPPITVVEGGADRATSVRAGLSALSAAAPDRVLVHDAARPCVPRAVVESVLGALDAHDGAAPGLPSRDALWISGDGLVTGLVDRQGVVRAQTPQGFRYDAIVAAHEAHPGGAADDVEVALAAGMDVAVVPGHPDNFKITEPDDFARAERALLARRGEAMGMDVRTGQGFDVHRFRSEVGSAHGDHVVLCCSRIPHARGLEGHSDADVGAHAIADAIYGALAEGDIGRHFPPTDPKWRNESSATFLRHAASLAAGRGFRLASVDCTLVCEAPKIAPHATEMRERLASVLDVDLSRVSVKATTSEGLGFTGRNEGIAALASVTLVTA